MKTRLLACFAALLLTACSSVQTSGALPQANFHAAEPFAVQANAPTPQIETLLREYVAAEFGRSLAITDGTPGSGTIEVTYVSVTDANGFATWQNSTTLLVIRGPDRARLWTGEYAYKGGMEMSGFAVNSAAEAAKLSVQRLAKKFEAEIHR